MKTFYQLVIILILSLGFYSSTKAQIPPSQDPNWILNVAQSDEFNGTVIDQTKWCIMQDAYCEQTVLPCDQGHYERWGGSSIMMLNNVSVSNGICSLRVDNMNPYTYNTCYQHQNWVSDGIATGGIMSQNSNYSYGYLEISALLPGCGTNGIAYAERFWPAFWAAYTCNGDPNGDCRTGNCRTIHNEIDILEPSGTLYQGYNNYVDLQHQYCAPDSFPNNAPAYNCCNFNGTVPPNTHFTSPTPLCDAFHKYAVEWFPNRIVFYFDDVPFYIQYNSSTFTMHPLQIFIDQQIQSSAANGGIDFNPNLTFPQFMQVDYFHYYQLIFDCSNSITLLSNTDVANFFTAPVVKYDITLGDNANSISLNVGDNDVFRAENTITVNGSLTVPLGAKLLLLPTPCF